MSEAPKGKKTQVVTGVGRLFYVNAFVARANDQGIEKFSTQFLWKKSDTAVTDAIRAAVLAAVAEFKVKFAKNLTSKGELPKEFRMPVRDGDAEYESETKTDPDYKGHYFFNASSKNKPGLVDANGQEITSQSEVYSGMFGKLIVNFYPYAVKGNCGIAAGLNGIQKIRDGEAKSGVGSVGEIFGRYESADGPEAGADVGF
jgi:hypothetical protein